MKHVIVGIPMPIYQNNDGVIIMNIYGFLMYENSLSI